MTTDNSFIIMSALSSGKIDKYDYLTEILPPDQSRILDQVRFTYSPLGKAFEKQTKTSQNKRKNQTGAITTENKRLEASTNKDDHKVFIKNI